GGRNGVSAGMSSAGVEAGSEFEAAIVVEIVMEVDAALRGGTRGLGRDPARVGADFPSLNGADLGPQARIGGEAKLLLEAHLGQPEPEIAGARKRGDADLGERTGLARVEDGLLDAGGNGAGLPVDFDGGRAQAHGGVSTAGEEIGVDRPVGFAAPD